VTVTLMLKRSDCIFDTVPIGGKEVEVVFWDSKMDKEEFLRVMMQCIVSDCSTFAVMKKEAEQ